MLKGKTVSSIVTEFTGKWQKVVDANSAIAEKQASIVVEAYAKGVAAEKEKRLAQNFIDNFEKLLIK